MRKLMLFVFLAIFCVGSAKASDSGTALVWTGDAPELHAKVVIMFFNPNASMLAPKEVTREGVQLFQSYREVLDKGPFSICIIRATNTSREDLLTGGSTVGLNIVYIKNKEGHFARIADSQKDLLNQIMKWDAKPKQSGEIL